MYIIIIIINVILFLVVLAETRFLLLVLFAECGFVSGSFS